MNTRKVIVLACLFGVLAGGCQSISKGLRGLGFESRASRLYRKQKADNTRLAAQNVEYETRLAALTTEHEHMRAKLASYKDRPAAAPPAPAPPQTASVDERWAQLLRSLGTIAKPIVSADGNKAVRVGGDIFFRSGKSSVRADARPTLRKIANAIRDFDDVVVFVDGHTDADPLRYTKAKYGDNYGLGAARANSVVKELTSLGVPRARLVPRSFGKDKPISNNRTTTGKRKNRRVEFTFAFPPPATSARAVAP